MLLFSLSLTRRNECSLLHLVSYLDTPLHVSHGCFMLLQLIFISDVIRTFLPFLHSFRISLFRGLCHSLYSRFFLQIGYVLTLLNTNRTNILAYHLYGHNILPFFQYIITSFPLGRF